MTGWQIILIQWFVAIRFDELMHKRWFKFYKNHNVEVEDVPLDREEQESLELTDEDFAPTPPKPKGPLNRLPPKADLKIAFIFYLISGIVSSIYWGTSFQEYLSLSKNSIFEDHEYWRAFTSVLIHSDLGHYLANGPLLIIFGWFLRTFAGPFIFPYVLFTLGALTNLCTVYFYSPETELLGASGMVYAMVAFWLVLYIRFDIDYSVPMRIFRSIGFSLLVMFPTTFQPRTSYLAHTLGFIIGLIFALPFLPLIKRRLLRL